MEREVVCTLVEIHCDNADVKSDILDLVSKATATIKGSVCYIPSAGYQSHVFSYACRNGIENVIYYLVNKREGVKYVTTHTISF